MHFLSFHATPISRALPSLFSHHTGSSPNHLNNRLFASHEGLRACPPRLALSRSHVRSRDIEAQNQNNHRRHTSIVAVRGGETLRLRGKKKNHARKTSTWRARVITLETLDGESALQLSRSHRASVHPCIGASAFPLRRGASISRFRVRISVKSGIVRRAIRGAYRVGKRRCIIRSFKNPVVFIVNAINDFDFALIANQRSNRIICPRITSGEIILLSSL